MNHITKNTTDDKFNGNDDECDCDICAGLAYICPLCHNYCENNYEGIARHSSKDIDLLICPDCHKTESLEAEQNGI